MYLILNTKNIPCKHCGEVVSPYFTKGHTPVAYPPEWVASGVCDGEPVRLDLAHRMFLPEINYELVEKFGRNTARYWEKI